MIVSLHANAAEDSRARGVELYVQSAMNSEEENLFLAHQENQIEQQVPKNSESLGLSKSSDLAAIIDDLHRQNKFFKSLEFGEIMKQMWLSQKPKSNVSIKQAPFYIISRSHIPAILVEIGFLSHAVESKQLKDPNYQQQIAEIIRLSVLQFLAPKNSDKLIAIY